MTRFAEFQKYFVINASSTSPVTQRLKENPKALISFTLMSTSYAGGQTVTFLDSNGNPVYGPLEFSTPFSIKETFRDWYSVMYTGPGIVYVFLTEIVPVSDEDRITLEEMADEEIRTITGAVSVVSPLDANGNLLVDLATPLPSGTNTIGNVGIANPLDANGNLKVDIESSTGLTISGPLDANGNVKVDLETPLPAGTNTIGNVNVANQPTVTESQSVTKFTSLPYSVPANGRVVFQVEGTGGTATISFNNGSTTYQLNGGAALTKGAIYEFSVAVASGDSFTISGATFIRGFFVSGVMAT